MWFWTRFGVATLLVAMLVAGGYSELVLDFRTPRSSLLHSHFVGSESSSHIEKFDEVEAAMKTKYGQSAETEIRSPPLRWVVTVGDKVVHEEIAPTTFAGVLGFFAIGRSQPASMFPFRLDPQVLPPPHKYSSMAMRERLQDSVDAKYLAFNDSDVAEGPCVVLAESDLGPIGKLLRVETGTFCIIDWNGKARASALIGAALARGDPWMRPFTRRICRNLTSLAVRKAAAVRTRLPEYAACILVDRPTRVGAPENLTVHAFEVGPGAALALIDMPKSGPPANASRK